jgi:hypothetical protein
VLDQLSVLKLVTGRLDSAGIPYMITGSLAAGHYAQPRFTRDIDLVVELRPEDAEHLASLFHAEFDCDVDTIRAAIERRSMFNLIHTDAIVKVDFIVRKETPYRLEEFRRRRPTVIDGQAMWMVSPEDLIISKLLWAKDTRSEVQLRDVRGIIEAHPVIDWTYVEPWAESLSVNELLREVRT